MRPPVFIPRPETEELVGHVLEHLMSHQEFQSEDSLNVLEVGCGSGAICLSLLKESPIWLRVLAVEQVNVRKICIKLMGLKKNPSVP